MAVFKEEFTRCTECDNAWFVPRRIVLLGKTSTDNHAVEMKERTEYVCSKCGQLKLEVEV